MSVVIAVTALTYARQEPSQELRSTRQSQGMSGSELINAGIILNGGQSS